MNSQLISEINFLFRYLQDVREASESELAGGYRAEYGYQRVMGDALCGLFFNFDIVKNFADQRTGQF